MDCLTREGRPQERGMFVSGEVRAVGIRRRRTRGRKQEGNSALTSRAGLGEVGHKNGDREGRDQADLIKGVDERGVKG